MARLSGFLTIGLCSLALAACSTSQPEPVQKTKEFFSQAVYGKASPRKVAANTPVPKGGGYYRIGKPYKIAGKTYVPKDQPNYDKTGKASWYGSAFHGRQTANGEIYDMNDLTAAHPTLPLPSYVRVTNLDNGRSVVVRVNDRGPFAHGRIIDVSKTAAGILGFEKQGIGNVRVQYVGRADMDGRDRNKLMATFSDPANGRSGQGLFGRGRVQVANVIAPKPRLRSAFSNDATLNRLRGTVGVASYVSPAATQHDPLAAIIATNGQLQSYAEPMRLSPALEAALDLANGR